MKKVVVAASGASGAQMAFKIAHHLPKQIQKHLILSEHAKTVLHYETQLDPSWIIHDNEDIAASISSGSFGVDGMIIAPCSMNTLAKIACGIADNLVTRCATVMIKERKKLLLAPREIPFSPIALENMHKLSMLGTTIAPAVLAYYSEQQTLEDMEDFIIGEWFDLLGIDNQLYKRWKQA